MDSVHELEEIRSRMLGEKPGRILISLGTCGVAAGAVLTLEASKDELAKRRLTGWEIVRTGCLGLCDREPLMVVEKPGEARVVYYGVNEARARQIIASHLVNNYIVGEWVLPSDEAIQTS